MQFIAYMQRILLMSLLLTIGFFGAARAACTVNPGDPYVTATATVSIGASATAQIPLYVENKPFGTAGTDPQQVCQMTVSNIEDYFGLLAQKAMTEDARTRLAQSITGTSGAGIYVKTSVNACGYNGYARTITCSSPSSARDIDFLGYLAHENMHGWEFQFTQSSSGVTFYRVFAEFANDVFHRLFFVNAISGNYNGQPWTLDYLTYGLQNESEWGSEVFADWLLGTAGRSVWPYIAAYLPQYQTYFNCLWTEAGATPDACSTGITDLPTFATSNPTGPNAFFDPVPLTYRQWNSASGTFGPNQTLQVSAADSASIWKVCFDPFISGLAQASDFAALQAIVDQVTGGNVLAANAAHNYSLMYADANHDGEVDWLCEYSGTVVGGQSYLWNHDVKTGAPTFVVSGKGAVDYVEYLQDPYSTLPSMSSGAIAQPQFREWQGTYGSANGSMTVASRSPYPWYSTLAGEMQAPLGKAEAMEVAGFAVNQLSGKCIDVVDWMGHKNGTPLVIKDCKVGGIDRDNNSPIQQLWEVTSLHEGFIVNQLNGKCIDVLGAPGTANGAKIQLWDCEFSGFNRDNGSKTDQTWTTDPDHPGFYINQLSGKCIDVSGAPGTADGSKLLLWDCEFSGFNRDNGSKTDQKWLPAAALP